jgi:acetolactate synthase-1/2/3 large subunit
VRVADYVIQKLYEHNCKHLFTVTGRGILFLTDALAKNEEMQSVHVHHEQSAAYAAMAYAQVNGEIGAALVSTGCGSTNAITGVLCAWQDDIPCVFISGQNKLQETTYHTKLDIRTYGQQEANIIPLVQSITKYSTMITDPTRIEYELGKALYLATTGRKGPVWIDIPLDVQNMRVEPNELEKYIPDELNLEIQSLDIDYVTSALKIAKRPIVLIGSGIRSAKAERELHTFLERNKIPAVYASSATDILDSSRVLAVGCVGAMGANRAGNFAIQNSDLVLNIGCRLSTMVMGEEVHKFAREAKIIAVDIDKNEHLKFPEKIDKLIIADAKDFLVKLNTKEMIKVSDAWIAKCQHWKDFFPKCEEGHKQGKEVDIYQFADAISEFLDGEANCITDSGLTELIVPTTISFRKGQRAIHPTSQGAMGYALPAGIGAYYSTKKQTVVAVGDGSIMMNLQELQTIAYNKIPLKIFVINNNCYSVIRKRQVDLFRTRTIGTDKDNGVSCPDFKKVAECFGLQYEIISSPTELKSKLPIVLNCDQPIICEVMAPHDQCYIHNSYRRTSKGKFVHAPIEDQSPFLDRETFLKEMLIGPIDQ